MTWLWLITAFSAAFLMFVVEPLLGKWLLPAYGGSPSTWVACMLFFQVMLLLGYAYAHLLPVRRRSWLLAHIAFALAAAACGLALRELPLASSGAAGLPPSLRIPLLLLLVAAAPFLLLASTAPLLQRWAAAAGERAPHRLYAVSNAGSLLALLAYPTLLEVALPLSDQYRLWVYACTAFALASSLCALAVWRRAPAVELPESAEPAISTPSPRRRFAAAGRVGLYWALCAFVPSVYLLAVTNHITIDVAPVPLLWVLPLALYLVSFIVVFGVRSQGWRRPVIVLFVIASIVMARDSFAHGAAHLARQIGVSLGAFFCAALLCHAELVRTRPADDKLTGFYLWIAVGGALGSVYVNLIAPLFRDDYFELEDAMLLTFALLALAERAQRLAKAPADVASPRTGWRRLDWPALAVGVPLLLASVALRAAAEGRQGKVLERRRGFLGAMRVVDYGYGRMLTHGRTRHGMQLSDPALRRHPTMYYAPSTMIGRLFERGLPERPRRIGVVGLGVGTLATFGRAGDVLRFYELNPDVIAINRRWFTFLQDTPAQVELAVGDGRLLLTNEPAQHFDALFLDAFASDSVPAHLLTREAFAIYLRHLQPDGLLIVNVANRYLDLDSVLRGIARSHGLALRIVSNEYDEADWATTAQWGMITRSQPQLDRILQGLKPVAGNREVLWTDERTSLWTLLR